MRGLAGTIQLDGVPVPPETVRRMIDAVAICPRDRIETWSAGPAGLAHFVRHEVPEDRFELQPLSAPDGRFILVTDAVLTNRDELAPALGWPAATAAGQADSALVAAAYEKWGAECVHHLEGRFVLAAWHPQERRFFAATDPLAFRPFYYRWRDGRFAFASTLRGLFALPEVSRELNPTIFAEGFSGMWRLSSGTLYQEIECLPRGSTLQLDDSGLRVGRYWLPVAEPELRLGSDSEYREAFYELLVRAIRNSLRTNGNTGVMVSGGLDSAAVTVLAGQILAARGQRLQAFHFFSPHPSPYVGELREADESSYVRDLQHAAPHIDFHFLPREPEPLMTADEMVRTFEDEQVPLHGLPLRPDVAWLGDLHRQNIGLVLSGLGGNALVSPQMRERNYLGHLGATGRWLTLVREVCGVHRVYGTPWRTLAAEVAYGSGWRRLPARELPLRLRLLHPDLRTTSGIDQRFQAASRFDRRSVRDFRSGQFQELTEKMAQHAGVSPAVVGRIWSPRRDAPLFDRRLNEFCLRLPPRQQFRDGCDRRLLREATRGLLPDRVRLRTTRGFAQASALETFARHRDELRQRLAQVLSDSAVAGFFDRSVARDLADRITQPHCRPQELHTAASLIGWSAFLTWRAGSR